MRKFTDCGFTIERTTDGGATIVKTVQVAPFDVSGLLRFAEEIRSVDLPLPHIDTKQVLGWAGEKADVASAVIDVFTKNMPAIFRWLTTSPQLLPVFLEETTNLDIDDISAMTGGEAWKTARAAWTACVNDGAFTEMAGFFGDLFRGAAVAGEKLVA